MAILGWITLLVGCPICVGFAIAAVLLGRTALGDIDAGIAEPRNRGLVEAGYWMGLALLILAGLILVCLIAALVSMVAPGSFWF